MRGVLILGFITEGNKSQKRDPKRAGEWWRARPCVFVCLPPLSLQSGWRISSDVVTPYEGGWLLPTQRCQKWDTCVTSRRNLLWEGSCWGQRHVAYHPAFSILVTLPGEAQGEVHLLKHYFRCVGIQFLLGIYWWFLLIWWSLRPSCIRVVSVTVSQWGATFSRKEGHLGKEGHIVFRGWNMCTRLVKGLRRRLTI